MTAKKQQITCQNRLVELVELLSRQGLSQAQIAIRAGIPPQYISDLRHGRRMMTELIARRIGEEFEVDYLWLLGSSDIQQRPKLVRPPTEVSRTLPVLSQPIEGEPTMHPSWDGSLVQIAGVAVSRTAVAIKPYILRLVGDDVEGRLRADDLLLMSQEPREQAEIGVVMFGKRCLLARRNPDGSWRRVTGRGSLPAHCRNAGHSVGIVWSNMVPA